MIRFNPENDYLVFDGLEELTLVHGIDVQIDYSTDRLHKSIVTTKVKNCLIRQVSERLSSTVRQIFERGKSIGNDSIPLADTVIEIPIAEATDVTFGDTLTKFDVAGNVKLKFTVLAVDKATLSTRWRAACRST